ncbi:hypothetical protein BC937DRAFT_91817, partial [Endogone sp. FLAS-F59071]
KKKKGAFFPPPPPHYATLPPCPSFLAAWIIEPSIPCLVLTQPHFPRHTCATMSPPHRGVRPSSWTTVVLQHLIPSLLILFALAQLVHAQPDFIAVEAAGSNTSALINSTGVNQNVTFPTDDTTTLDASFQQISASGWVPCVNSQNSIKLDKFWVQYSNINQTLAFFINGTIENLIQGGNVNLKVIVFGDTVIFNNNFDICQLSTLGCPLGNVNGGRFSLERQQNIPKSLGVPPIPNFVWQISGLEFFASLELTDLNANNLLCVSIDLGNENPSVYDPVSTASIALIILAIVAAVLSGTAAHAKSHDNEDKMVTHGPTHTEDKMVTHGPTHTTAHANAHADAHANAHANADAHAHTHTHTHTHHTHTHHEGSSNRTHAPGVDPTKAGQPGQPNVSSAANTNGQFLNAPGTHPVGGHTTGPVGTQPTPGTEVANQSSAATPNPNITSAQASAQAAGTKAGFASNNNVNPTVPSPLDVVGFSQFIAAASQLSVNYPAFHSQVGSNFGWTMGYLNFPWIVSALDNFRNTVCKYPESAALYQQNLTTLFSPETVLTGGTNGTTHLSYTNNNTNPTGLDTYAKILHIPLQDLFLNVLIIFLLFMCIVAVLVFLFLGLLQALKKKHPNFFAETRTHWFLLAYFALAAVAFYQLTIHDCWPIFAIALIVIIFFIIGLMAFLTWRIIQYRTEVSRLFSTFRLSISYGALYTQYTIKNYNFFTWVLIYTLAKSAFQGLAQGSPWVQIIGLLAIEIVFFGLLVSKKPLEKKVAMWLNGIISAVRILTLIGMIFLISDLGLSGVPRSIASLVVLIFQGLAMLCFTCLTLWNVGSVVVKATLTRRNSWQSWTRNSLIRRARSQTTKKNTGDEEEGEVREVESDNKTGTPTLYENGIEKGSGFSKMSHTETEEVDYTKGEEEEVDFTNRNEPV